MKTYRAERDIAAHPEAIAAIILNISELAEWNPALTATGTADTVARVDHPYAVTLRAPGRARLTYVQSSVARIVWRVDIGGSVETGEWDLLPRGRTTRVTHTMSHTGALLAILGGGMTSVPTWRLDRLQARAEAAEHERRRR